jgi:hypothetical protein
VRPGAPATRLDASQIRAAELVLSEVAERELAGAAPIGKLVAGQFTAGQSLVGSVPVRVGACYSVVAVGLPPVTRLELALRSAEAVEFGAHLVTADGSLPHAVMGGKNTCLEWPRAEPGVAEFVLTVRAGQGVALVRVYEQL